MREACEHARIIPPISFHILRHTWASLAVMARVPLLVVAKNLGHKDTRTTAVAAVRQGDTSGHF
jgi:integrase